MINAFEPFKLARFASINTPNANSYIEKANGCFYVLTETVEEVWGAFNDARGYFIEPSQEIRIFNDDGTVTIHNDKSKPYHFPVLSDDYIFYKSLKNLKVHSC